MNTPATMLCLVMFAIGEFIPPSVSAQRSSENAHYSQRELKQMIRGAHTPVDYQRLALYFQSRKTDYTNQATAEKAEWDRRKEMTSGPAVKFPNVESARNLYQYYLEEAKQMATRAADDERRAQQATAHPQ